MSDFQSQIQELTAQAKEIDVRATLISHYLGAVLGVTKTWNERDIYSDKKFFFDVALNALKDGLIINTCALLHSPVAKREDDAILPHYRDFLQEHNAVDALIAHHRRGDPHFSDFHEKKIRASVVEFLEEMRDIDPVSFDRLIKFRSKRIVHSTTTRLDKNPPWKDLFRYARIAVSCADLAYRIFHRSSFDHDGAEKNSYESAAKAVLPHLDEGPRRGRRSGRSPLPALDDGFIGAEPSPAVPAKGSRT